MNLQKNVTVDCCFPYENYINRINDPHFCHTGCQEKKCIYVCPAGLFRELDGEVRFDSEGICLECGACRLVCDNVEFDYPPGGTGIIHRFG